MRRSRVRPSRRAASFSAHAAADSARGCRSRAGQCVEIGGVDQHARAEREHAERGAPAPRRARRESSKVSLPMTIRRRPASPSCTSSSGRTSAPRPRSIVVAYGAPLPELDASVERIRRPPPQLHHPRRRPPSRPPAAPSSPSRPARCWRCRRPRRGRRSMVARVVASHGRLDWRTRSAAVSARASRASAPRTFWITDRIAAMAPTPMATQRKKKISRCQAARISRATMRRTKVISRLSGSAPWAVRSSQPPRAPARCAGRCGRPST